MVSPVPAIEGCLRRRLGTAVTLLGPLSPDRLAAVYATADLYVSPSGADLFGQSILEAQASGLPVVAVDGGAASELIDSGRDGCLVPPIPEALAGAIVGLARRSTLCDRLVTGGARGRAAAHLGALPGSARRGVCARARARGSDRRGAIQGEVACAA